MHRPYFFDLLSLKAFDILPTFLLMSDVQ